jgi:2-methylcitrate dehydratase PrpD
LGYGVTTSPELAAYANTCMVRHTDFNDHASDMMPGVLAIGEAPQNSNALQRVGEVRTLLPSRGGFDLNAVWRRVARWWRGRNS